MEVISREVARRFVLGKQGLWPGRRWRGLSGTEAAMTAMQHLQLDPLQILARSQDLKLHARVLDYAPESWQTLTYGERKFFDWGGWLAVRPMSELPYWRRLMHRERDLDSDWLGFARQHAASIAEMRRVLAERETVTNREFGVSDRKRVESGRGRKDSALALYYLWRTGEVMTHHRERFERVYARTESVAPAHLITEAGDAETDRFIFLKEIAFHGLHRGSITGDLLQRRASVADARRLREALLQTGELMRVQVEGRREVHYARSGDLPLLRALCSGRVPEAWKPIERTTEEECLFLAPLDVVSARGRAKKLFDFDYVWEVYKPEPDRRWGYYVLPVLWGDRLVARFDSRLDRASRTLVILRFWLEDRSLAKNAAFAQALGAAFARFRRFLGADKMNAKAIPHPDLRRASTMAAIS